MTIVITLLAVTLKNAPNKRADAKLLLDGSLEGFELNGFQIWARGDAVDAYRVDFPARSFKQQGETRYFTVLRDLDPELMHSDALKDAIIAAYLAEKGKGKDARRAPVQFSPASTRTCWTTLRPSADSA